MPFEIVSPGIIIPNDPDLAGIIEIRYWKDGRIRVSRPREKDLALKMMEKAYEIILNKTHSEGGMKLNFMPDIQEALRRK
jgi:hypothetical protein